jgi:hypothetical protein
LPLLTALVLPISDFLDLRDGPDAGGDFRVSPSFFLAVLGAGFAIGILGHIIRSRTLVAIGVILVFAATVVLPIAYTLSR